MTLDELTQIRLSGNRPQFQVFATLLPGLVHVTSAAVPINANSSLIAFARLRVCLCFRGYQLETALNVCNRMIKVEPEELILWGLDNGRFTQIVDCGVRCFYPAIIPRELSDTARKLADILSHEASRKGVA